MIHRATRHAARPQGVLDQPYRYPTDHSLRQVRDSHPDLPPGTRTTDMMDLAQGMVVAAARAALGDDLVVRHGGHAIDLGATPWPRKRFADMIEERTRERMHPSMPIGEARAVLDRLGLAYEGGWGAGRLMKEVYDEKVQHDVAGPVFCIDYSREVSPLARAHRDDPAYVERFELIVAGFELCNAYSEQNDPAPGAATRGGSAGARKSSRNQTSATSMTRRTARRAGPAQGFLSVPGLGELLVPKAVCGVSRPSAPPRSRPAVDHPVT